MRLLMVMIAYLAISSMPALADPPHGNVTRLHLWLLRVQVPSEVAVAAEACEKHYDTLNNVYFPDFAESCNAVNAKLIDAERSASGKAADNAAAERALIDAAAKK